MLSLCLDLPACGCNQSKTYKHVNFMRQRHCEEDGRFDSLAGRSIPGLRANRAIQEQGGRTGGGGEPRIEGYMLPQEAIKKKSP